MAKIQELVAVEKGLTPAGAVTAAPQTPQLVRTAFSDSPSLDGSPAEGSFRRCPWPRVRASRVEERRR